MDIQVAAIDTIEFINKYTYENQTNWPDDVESLSYDHVMSMLLSIELGDMKNDKANRWLGWAQCAAVSVGVGTLEDMKQINKGA